MPPRTLAGILLPIAVLIAAAPASGQSSPPADAARSVLDGVYSEAQAARGETVFARVCAACHAAAQFAGRPFLQSWTGGSVYMLYNLIRSSMPQDRPGALSAQEYADVVAYILRLNSLPTGERELGTAKEELAAIRIEPKPEPPGR